MTANFFKDSQLIKEMFNNISGNYDKLNDIMTFGLHKKIKKNVIKAFIDYKPFIHSPKNPFTIVDLCTGTGDLAALLKKEYPNAQVGGVDFSPKMLDIARVKHPEVAFLEADCTNLPFEDEQFDLCIISFGLRNVEDIEKALKEIYRILKKDGLFINIDLGKPNKFFNFFLKPYMYFWVSFVGKLFHGDKTPYRYLAESNETFPSPKELIKAYEKVGFSEIKNKNYLFGQISSQLSKK